MPVSAAGSRGGTYDDRIVRVADLDLDDDLRWKLAKGGEEVVDVLLPDLEPTHAWTSQDIEELECERPRDDRVDPCIDRSLDETARGPPRVDQP